MKLYEEFKEYENLWDDEVTEQRYKVIMVVDDEEYVYGTYDSRNRANEIAMKVRDERDVETYVEADNKNNFCTSYVRKINGKDYDLTKADELRAAMEAANNDRRAMWLKNVILDGEAARFTKETEAMALRVWQEYKRDHELS